MLGFWGVGCGLGFLVEIDFRFRLLSFFLVGVCYLLF